MCRLEFRFQTLLAKNVLAKNVPLRVNGRPFRHIVHRFQKVPESCKVVHSHFKSRDQSFDKTSFGFVDVSAPWMQK